MTSYLTYEELIPTKISSHIDIVANSYLTYEELIRDWDSSYPSRKNFSYLTYEELILIILLMIFIIQNLLLSYL